MPAYTDTDAYPAFTSKQEILRALLAEAHNCPVLEDLVYKLNNTNLNGLADKATTYKPDATFASS